MNKDLIREDFVEARNLLDRFIADPVSWQKMLEAAALMTGSLAAGGKILACGNGGSLTQAMHFAAELTGRYRDDRHPLPALALTDPAHITCTGNDMGFDQAFARQVKALGKPGDILLALSTSGNSPDILQAIEAARSGGMRVIALSGLTGGLMAGTCDVIITVHHAGYADRIQEIHLMILHALAHYLDNPKQTEDQL